MNNYIFQKTLGNNLMTENQIQIKPNISNISNKPKIKVVITKKKLLDEQANNELTNELILQTEDELLQNIIKQYVVGNKFTLPDIILQESPTDIELQKRIVNTYFKLITQQLHINIDCKINTEINNNIIDWNTLRKYQKDYILEVIDKLKNNKKCILKSPTGSGKTVMFYWVIVKLFELLSKSNKFPDKFNILLLTPRIKLCNQSINEFNKNILKYNGINAKYLKYDYENREESELVLKTEIIKPNYLNFISSTYQSLPNLYEFIKKTNINIDLVIFDEFHYIVTWDKNTNKKDILNSHYFNHKLFTSATPYKSQETNSALYGSLIDKVSVKHLIDLDYLCPIIPIVEIDNDKPITPDEIILKKKLGKYCKLPLLISDTFTRYNKKKAILFCNDTSNCWELYDLLENNKELLNGIKVFQPYVSVKRNTKTTNKPTTTTKNTTKNIENENENDNDTESVTSTDSSSDFSIDSPLDLIEEENKLLDKLLNKDFENIENVLKKYESCNEPCILITCKKIDMGYDHPPIDLVIIADNKASLVDITQVIGRGLRKTNDYINKVCHILLPIRVKDINDNNFKSVKNYLEYLQNNVGLNIEYFIREQILKQRAKINGLSVDSNTQPIQPAQPAQPNQVEDYTKLYNNMKFINSNWVKIYDSLTILPTGLNKMKFEFNMLRDNIKGLGLQNKTDYKKWATDNNEDISPEIKYNADGWANYYHFLDIDISKFPKTIDEFKQICTQNNIKTKEIYEKNMNKLNLPSMPEELYKPQAKGKGKITLCRDTSKCFTDGQQIRHSMRGNNNKTRIGIYDSKKDLIKFEGKYLTMNQFVKTHYELERPNRSPAANAWLECECKISDHKDNDDDKYNDNDNWVSTHNLPDISNNFIQFLQ